VILTGGHCAEDITNGAVRPAGDFAVVTGDVDWADTVGRQLSAVSQVVVYPGFNPTDGVGDVALLVLATPTSAPAIPLATSADSSLLAGGTPATIAGWGLESGSAAAAPTSLQAANTAIQDTSYCTTQETADHVAFDPSTELCAYTGTTGTCRGDSGGPIVATRPDQTLVEVGVTSHGDANCDPSDPTVYARVDLVATWAAGWIAAVKPPPSAPPSSTATTTPAPAPSPEPVPKAVLAVPSGSYVGHTLAGRHPINLTVARGGHALSRVGAVMTLHCAHGHTHAVDLDGLGTTHQKQLSPIGSFDLRLTGYHDRYVRRLTWHFTGTISADGSARGTTSAVATGRTRLVGHCLTSTLKWAVPATGL
jgi:hypothetical protein